MTEETAQEIEAPVTETPVEAPVETPKGLDAIISSAIDKHYVDDTVKPAAAPDEPPAGKARDEKTGRFVSGAAQQSTGSAEAAPPTATEPAIEPAEKPLDAPAHYTAEQKAAFNSLPREAQQYWVRTEKEREADFTRRSQEAAELKRTAEPYLKAVEPYKAYLQQIAPTIGQTPDQMIGSILAAEHALRTGDPVTKAQAFAQLAQTYGINVAQLASGQMPAQHQPQQASPYLDPRLLQKLQEHDRILAEQKRERELQNSNQQISDFANEKDANGQPKHPYFEKVRAVMASIVQSGQAETLADAYELAIAPIKDVIERETKAADLARQQALEKAKKAAPVKTSSGTNPKGTSPLKGMDAHIAAAIAKAGIA